MNARKLFCCCAAVVGAYATMNADIVMNEIMQSNIDCIMDDLNEFPDSWLELYNTGSSDVNLAGYRVGLTDDPSAAFTLTNGKIKAGGYALVYCDKAGDGMHTDFRIDSGKGTLYLFDPSGQIIDSLDKIKKQPAPNVAYGRKTDGTGKWGYELQPTPGKSNTGGTTDNILAPIVFSMPGGVWKDRQDYLLELYLEDGMPEEAVIKYTTDGSEPSATNGDTYTSPIAISSSTVVRAKAICDGWISIPSNANSYIFLGRDMQIPVISIIVDRDYLYDNNIGIFTDGGKPQGQENYRQDWRRPINLEYFAEEDEEAVFNQLCETRIQGAYTRTNPLKSMTFYSNKRFGVKRFYGEFWPKDRPGMTEVKSFILRNGGNDYMWTYLRDPLIQRVIGRNTDIDWQAYSPVIVFINGKYHAMLAMRERSSEDNIAANYGGLEDIDMFENWYEIKSGDWKKFNELKDFINDIHSLDEWQEVIDVNVFCNLMAINYWVYNTDFPHNNTVIWRRNAGGDTDGRWRWLVKDTDFGLGIWNSNENIEKNFHDFLMKNNQDPMMGYELYRSLWNIPEFRDYYLNRLIVYRSEFLNANTIKQYLDEMVEENHGEQQISHDKWKYESGAWWSDLNSNLNHIRSWADRREEQMTKLLTSTFSLGSSISLTVNNDMADDEAAELHLTYNGVTLSKGKFDGTEFIGRTIVLEGTPEDCIVGWTVKYDNGGTKTYDTPKLSLKLSKRTTTRISPIIDRSGIKDVTTAVANSISYTISPDGVVTTDTPVSVYDMSGRLVSASSTSTVLPAKGTYIIASASARAKVVW